MGYGFELRDSRWRPVTGSRKHGNKLSGSIICWEILEWVSDCCLLKISVPCRSQSQSQSYVTTDGQSANLSWCQAPPGAYDQIFITARQLRFLSLRRENGSAVYNCCWFSPAQSFLGPSPAGLVTIFYCLRFETPQPGGPGPRIYILQE
jgi:hypothetical protein